MAKGNRTAVGVHLGHVKSKIPCNRNRLGGKGLIGLDHIHLVNRHAGSLHDILNCCDRSDTHDGRINAAHGAADILCQNVLDTELLSLVLTHNHDCRSTVVDAGGISCRHKTTFLAGAAAKLGQTLCGCAGTGSFISIDHIIALLAVMESHRNDLILKCPISHSLLSLLLGLGRKGVKLLAGQAPLLSDILSGNHHVIMVEGVGQSVIDHRVHQSSIVHAIAEAGIGQGIGGHRHILHTSGNNNISLTCLDHVGSLDNALETGTTYNVHCQSGNLHGDTCLDGSLTGHILSQAGLNNASHLHFVNHFGINASSL